MAMIRSRMELELALSRLKQTPRRGLTLDQVCAMRHEIKQIEWEMCRYAFALTREKTKPADDPLRVLEDRLRAAAKRPPPKPKAPPPPVKSRVKPRRIGSNPIKARDVWRPESKQGDGL